VFGKVQVKFI